jgi:hypothetical protein
MRKQIRFWPVLMGALVIGLLMIVPGAQAGGNKQKCLSELEQPPHNITAKLLNPHKTEILIKAFYTGVEGCDSWQRLGKLRVQLKQHGKWADLNGNFWYPLTSAKYKNTAHGFGLLDFDTHDGVREEREHGHWQPARVRFINFVKNVETGKIVGHGEIKDQPVKIKN